MSSVFLTAEWRKLIMVQYAIDPAVLDPWLPPGVTLDLYQGACLVSLVGFVFDRVRIKGLPIPFHTRFDEVNLRFYVRREHPDGTYRDTYRDTYRRGVVFIREFVPRAAITLIANWLYEEPYATLPMRSSIAATEDALHVRYEWRFQKVWQSMAVEASPAAEPIAPGSEAEFITEHYWGYTKRTAGATSQYAVQHPRWRTYAIRSHAIRADFGALYGTAFAFLSDQAPTSVLLAEGSGVSVAAGTRLRGSNG